MPENRTTCARSYTGSPVTAESEVFLAIGWAFSLDYSLGWSSIGIIISSFEDEPRLSHLHRMRSRGIWIRTIDQALTAQDFSDVMMAYRSDPQTLIRTQDIPTAIGIAALAADRSIR